MTRPPGPQRGADLKLSNGGDPSGLERHLSPSRRFARFGQMWLAPADAIGRLLGG